MDIVDGGVTEVDADGRVTARYTAEEWIAKQQAKAMDENHEAMMAALKEAFGYRPDEKGGEKWTVYRRDYLVVIHPERRPRIYNRNCGGAFYEIEPQF